MVLETEGLKGALVSAFDPSLEPRLPCSHSPSWKSKVGEGLIPALATSLRLAHLQDHRSFLPQASMVPFLTCSWCRGARRIFACLECPAVVCAGRGHLEEHQRKAGHTFALEVRLKTMWCGQCRDSVHCAEVDRLSDRIGAETARLVASLSSGRSSFKLPRMPYWKPRMEERQLLRKHTTPLPCPRLRGLRNLGSTCFLASVTQMFLHNPLLKHHFLSGGHARAGASRCSIQERKGACFSCEMDTLFAQIWGNGDSKGASKAERTDPSDHHVVIRHPLPTPQGSDTGSSSSPEHSSDGTLSSSSSSSTLHSPSGRLDRSSGPIRARIVKEMDVSGGVPPTGIIWTLWGAGGRPADTLDSPSLSPTSLAGYAQQDAHEYFITALNMLHASSPGCREDGGCTCIVHTLFSGVLGSQIRCDRCENATLTLDPILDLSLDIHPEDQESKDSPPKAPILLADCIDRYTREERLHGMNYTCGQCGYASKEVSKQMSIHQLPTVLHIQLKRFKHGYHGGEKLETPISLPPIMDMTPYTTAGVNARRRGGQMTSPLENRYQLFGLVCHQGRMDTGHYTAYIRIRKQWYYFDDHMVRPSSEAEVSRANG
ncbi:MAG: hypothetical protein DHS80DRAFT_29325 [Piptocephalis tieghemiana]|nr:MAG: hypothetical protein DHS80DRAFT_29325 [Piptocephalis tieghemiana]